MIQPPISNKSRAQLEAGRNNKIRKNTPTAIPNCRRIHEKLVCCSIGLSANALTHHATTQEYIREGSGDRSAHRQRPGRTRVSRWGGECFSGEWNSYVHENQRNYCLLTEVNTVEYPVIGLSLACNSSKYSLLILTKRRHY